MMVSKNEASPLAKNDYTVLKSLYDENACSKK